MSMLRKAVHRKAMKSAVRSAGRFTTLTSGAQRKVLKERADVFIRKFGTVIDRLANE